MSDSPLDGGSGWPTSAYAIIRRPEGYLSANGSSPASTKNGAEPLVEKIKVPQQTSWPAGVEAATADPEPPNTVEQSDPGPSGNAPRTLAIAGALVVLVALAVAVFFAVRGNRTDANAPANSTPTVTADVNTVVEPESSTSVSFAPETTTSVTGDVLRAGSVRLSIGPDGANESFDFDSGAKGASSTFTGEQQPDLDALTQELRAVQGAHVAVWTKPGAPTEAGCRALPSGDWTSSITVEPGLTGPTVCVQTSEGRVASFVARPIDLGPGGGVQIVYLDFTVWKKAGD